MTVNFRPIFIGKISSIELNILGDDRNKIKKAIRWKKIDILKLIVDIIIIIFKILPILLPALL